MAGKTIGPGVGPGGDGPGSVDVLGQSNAGTGVQGQSNSGTGVEGGSNNGRGVSGTSKTWQGVYGYSNSQAGVVGESLGFDGVYGVSHVANHAGVSGHNMAGGFAGWFDGNVTVNGDATHNGNVTVNGNATVTGTITANVDIFIAHADCAEDFDIAGVEQTEPGTVMVIEQEGILRRSERAYDKRVAGVISGAGDYKPGIVLDKQQSSGNRMPVALVGKVYCKVDAQYAPIEVGDLLTSSATPGHAMKADDPVKSFGSVIGKALRPLADGRGLIPILIALQ